jgi:3-oxoacyl-[acyl-carrier protein] reductase
MPGVQDRIALVTGAAQGIGAEVARRLAAGGAKVAVLDLDETAAGAVAKEIGGLAVAADVSKREQVQAAVDAVVAEFGGLQILVNNAGVIRDNLLFKMTDDDWTAVMEVHLRGAFLASQIAQQHMVAARYGRIISMSSTSALGNRGQANYSTAKAGLQGLTKTLAIELGPFGVTANAVAPGFVETAMTKATAERIGTTIEQMRESVAQTAPVRRSRSSPRKNRVTSRVRCFTWTAVAGCCDGPSPAHPPHLRRDRARIRRPHRHALARTRRDDVGVHGAPARTSARVGRRVRTGPGHAAAARSGGARRRG